MPIGNSLILLPLERWFGIQNGNNMSEIKKLKEGLEKSIKSGDINQAIAVVMNYNYLDGFSVSWNYKNKTITIGVTNLNTNVDKVYTQTDFSKKEALIMAADITDTLNKTETGVSKNALGIVNNILKNNNFGSSSQLLYAGVGLLALAYMFMRK